MTVSRGLIKYEGPAYESSSRDVYGDGWQQQVDMAASCLAAAALTGGMPKVAGTLSERQLTRFLSGEVAKRRRVANTKLAVIMIAEAVALAAGCYIGMLS
ncbi:MAG TPA: hypothetical protein VGI92_05940 [Gemmatimonadales bacterium]